MLELSAHETFHRIFTPTPDLFYVYCTLRKKSGKPLEELSPLRNDFLFGHGLIFMTRTAEFNLIFVASYSFFTSS